MKWKNRIIILSILILSVAFIGCYMIHKSEFDRLEQAQNEIIAAELAISDSLNRLALLEPKINELKDELSQIAEATTLHNYHEDLIDLSTYENKIFEDFKSDYDADSLIGLTPISICKMYLYAGITGDYETQYELYTTNEDYVYMTKDEFLNIPDEERMSDFEFFKDVYDLSVYFSSSNGATISWKSKNGYFDEEQGAFRYGFSLQKDGEVWKVNFYPLA